jgi:predicted transglutaminase-like cysteine proteinase
MFGRVAAWGFAAFLVVWPVHSGIETDTFAAATVPAAAAATTTMPDRGENQAANTTEAPSEDKIVQVEGRPEGEDRKADDATPPAKPGALDPAQPAIAPPAAAEPFGLAAVGIAGGGVLTKWSGVEADIRAESEILARCQEDSHDGHQDNHESCPPAAQNFLAIVAQGRAQAGRARVGVINRAINLAIRPMSDLAQWGVLDRWSAPLETFATGRGDCEDYAIAKYVALTAAGVAAQDVKLVIVRNGAGGEDHAVVAVHVDDKWIMLDNRWLTLVEDVEMPDVIPLFVLDSSGVRQFAPAAIASKHYTSAPASL